METNNVFSGLKDMLNESKKQARTVMIQEAVINALSTSTNLNTIPNLVAIDFYLGMGIIKSNRGNHVK